MQPVTAKRARRAPAKVDASLLSAGLRISGFQPQGGVANLVYSWFCPHCRSSGSQRKTAVAHVERCSKIAEHRLSHLNDVLDGEPGVVEALPGVWTPDFVGSDAEDGTDDQSAPIDYRHTDVQDFDRDEQYQAAVDETHEPTLAETFAWATSDEYRVCTCSCIQLVSFLPSPNARFQT